MVSAAVAWEILTHGVLDGWLVATPPTFLASYFITQKSVVLYVAEPGTTIKPIGQVPVVGLSEM